MILSPPFIPFQLFISSFQNQLALNLTHFTLHFLCSKNPMVVSPEISRRSSARIKQLDSKINYADPPEEKLAKNKRSCVPKAVSNKKQKVEKKESDAVEIIERKSADVAGCSNDVEMVTNNVDAGAGNVHELVKQTLRTFNKHYLHFIQEEEKRCGKEKAEETSEAVQEDVKEESPKAKRKSKLKTKVQIKKKSKRPDLKAITKMIQEKSAIHPEKRIGHIPGVDVGHQFSSRAEMVVVGCHHHWLNGIDYIGQNPTKASKDMVLKDYKFPLTVSIVMSGQYEDDHDNINEIVYTGQGGNDLLGNKRQIKDQVMERGNLGLKNCMEQSVPVRVVRGRKYKNSYVGKVYSYDGLYKVVEYWAEKGVSGFTVYKYRLRRLEGQASLAVHQVQFERGRAPASASEMRGLVCKDISKGLEAIPIPVSNMVDDPPVFIEGFTYITEMKMGHNVEGPTIASTGCKCKGQCIDPSRCSCAKLNGGDFPYVQKNGGRLVEPKAVVFECGPHCGCGPSCVNRTSQNGPKYRLEVYRTPLMGWGVRSWDYIPSGAPVCEYVGYLKRTDDIDPLGNNDYVFDIDCLQTMKGLDGRGEFLGIESPLHSRLKDVALPPYMQKVIDDEVSETVPFCIDAAETGNVTRFINHSCQPNLFVQCILSDHHDMTQARIVLIAADNIPPLQELSYDYGYALDSVVGPDGNIRQLICHCGAEGCRGRLF